MEGEQKKQVDSDSPSPNITFPQASVKEPPGAEESVITESKSIAFSKDVDSVSTDRASSPPMEESSNVNNESESHDGEDIETKLESGKARTSNEESTDQSATAEIDPSLVESESRIHDHRSEENKSDDSANSKAGTETEHVTAVDELKEDSNSSTRSSLISDEDKRMMIDKNIVEAPIQTESSRPIIVENEDNIEKSDVSKCQVASDKRTDDGDKDVESLSSSSAKNLDVPTEEFSAKSKSPGCVPQDDLKGSSSAGEEENTIVEVNQDSASEDVSETSSAESHNSANVDIGSKDSPRSFAKSPVPINDQDIRSTQCEEIPETSVTSKENFTSKGIDNLHTLNETSTDVTSEQKDKKQIDGKEAEIEESESVVLADSDEVRKEVSRETKGTNLSDVDKQDNCLISCLEPDSNLSKVSEDSVNADSDVIPSSASADLDHENVEEPMDVGTQNDEDDPFFSCRDKEKDRDLPVEVDDPAPDHESEMLVDEPPGNYESSSHGDIPGMSLESNANGDKSKKGVLEKDCEPLTTTSPVENIPTALDADMVSPEKVETLSSSDHSTGKEIESSVNEDVRDAEKPVALSGKGMDEAVTNVDDEVCIVPDTAPRILTDKEKADAFEKAKSSTDTVEKISVKTNEQCEKSAEPPVEADTGRDGMKDSSKVDDEGKTEIDKSDKESDGVKRKFSIQLVSTASLVSKKQTPEKDKEYVIDISDIPDDVQTDSNEEEKCAECGKVVKCKYHLKQKGVYLCEDECYTRHRKTSDSGSTSAVSGGAVNRAFTHKCGQCSRTVQITNETTLTWETMDFCSEDCLEKYQKNFGACCANCKGAVQSASLGKYCVRFGYDMKQFCSALCLEDFKKGLKVCSYCQKDISGGAEGFLAPVGDKGQFKDFCTQVCMEKYDKMSNNSAPPEVSHECAVCKDVKLVKLEISMHSEVQKLCSEPCFAAYKFVNKINTDQCDMCKKHFDLDRLENFSVFYDDAPHSFCCKTCMNVYILAKRKIVPCTWCKVKKYNFDMIKKTSSNGQALMWCSLHCLNLYQVSLSAAGTLKQIKCDSCNTTAQAQYHLTMSDATLRSFCTYSCVQSFQGKFPNTPLTLPGNEKQPHPLGLPRRITPKRTTGPAAPVGITGGEKDSSSSGSMPVISSVTSLAPANGLPSTSAPSTSTSGTSQETTKSSGTETAKTAKTAKTVFKQQFIIRPPIHPEMSNCAVQVKPISSTKAVSCRPHTCTVGTQTDDSVMKPVLIPVPVPIYIPAPMHMYTSPYPVPVPIVLPIPVPIFIPTTRNSAKGIFKEIKRIQEKFPSDPFEAELLMMAEMVAGEKKAENTDTESEDGGNGAADDDDDADDANDANDAENVAEPEFSPENVEANNSFGDDVLQIALKMASELDEPAVDFEAAVTPTTIAQTVPTQTSQPTVQNNESEEDEESPRKTRSGRKRTVRSAPRSSSVTAKRGRKSTSPDHTNITPTSESKVPAMAELVEKPDANMCLKFTFGVNAWKWWVNHKNAELEKAGGTARKMKPFKTDLLQLTADELNYSLCLFVKEVKKPNGQDYAPDTIYYLCLGIQQYLIENGRVENIFSDPYYEKFTDCLDEVAKQFSNLFSDAQYLVTRIEEEHLWESKQLGAHSPYVLLSTLMFFNTKHFNLTTVEEHMQLSFTHIMKHWKRNPNATGGPKAPGSRNVLLRFYPPQSALAANSKKKKVYEQQENEDNPLRCPVKLYEFYLSKCPESVKTRNDVFYLLPERSCVPDSPVWYSTMALGYDQLQKMLHRIKMVKEINML